MEESMFLLLVSLLFILPLIAVLLSLVRSLVDQLERDSTPFLALAVAPSEGSAQRLPFLFGED